MPISQITPYSTYGVSAATYLPPTPQTNQAPRTTETSAPKAFHVELSGAALARSLELQGYSAAMIASKMGVDLKTVDLYLGITP